MEISESQEALKERKITMKKYSYLITIGLLPIVGSAVMYYVNYLLFGDAHHLFQLVCEELAYMPLYILITAVIAERLLSIRDKAEMSKRTNSLVGTFFTEIGYDLIKIFIKFDENYSEIKENLINVENWDASVSKHIRSVLENHKYKVSEGREDLYLLYDFLMAKKDFILILMSNSNLLEEGEFSELLLSVNHILEEFRIRGEISVYDNDDIEHLHIDIDNAYRNLINGWVKYMLHLKKEYNPLYKLVLRKNPFIKA